MPSISHKESYHRYTFPGRNEWDIPDLPPAATHLTPAWVCPYTAVIRSEAKAEGAVHFFLHDYRFESAWTTPLKSLQRVKHYRVALTPDFSLYREVPRITQMWQVYRNRWCGAFWTLHGISVIPSVAWGGGDTFEFAFLGIARHSMVAVSSLGVNLRDEYIRERFLAGFCELVRRIDPCRVLAYGSLPPEAYALAEVYTYPTRWKGIVTARRRGMFTPTDERRFLQTDVLVEGAG
jgi:hypothetical protein